jgi:Archaeal TRASH domain
MKRTLPILGVLLASFCGLALHGDEATPKRTPKEALQAFNDLIGSWRGTGTPQQGTKEERDKNFWQETIAWEWQFKDKDAWLKAKFDKSKYFDGGELRYLPATDRYQLTLRTLNKETLVFEGPLKDKRLTLDRTDTDKKETQRLIVSLLHSNRYLYRYEVKSGDQTLFTALYQVGATKEGVPFAEGDGKPVCVVSGGLGTIQVMHKGKTYYVCCSGCRDAFKDDPETYIKEFEEKQAKKKE